VERCLKVESESDQGNGVQVGKNSLLIDYLTNNLTRLNRKATLALKSFVSGIVTLLLSALRKEISLLTQL
jgi:hypothetical protein